MSSHPSVPQSHPAPLISGFGHPHHDAGKKKTCSVVTFLGLGDLQPTFWQQFGIPTVFPARRPLLSLPQTDSAARRLRPRSLQAKRARDARPVRRSSPTELDVSVKPKKICTPPGAPQNRLPACPAGALRWPGAVRRGRKRCAGDSSISKPMPRGAPDRLPSSLTQRQRSQRPLKDFLGYLRGPHRC
ncbi:hypothetical protein CSPX01_07085 [Colletotrichum filicis]|nr:hypothetical protein CSPX01_07085 [Colletotrichum filicis]